MRSKKDLFPRVALSVAKCSALILVCYALFSGPKVQALAPSFKLTLSPIFQNLVIKRGSSVSGSMDVYNQGSYSINYLVYARPYGVTNFNYSPVFRPLAGRPNISKWFSLSSSSGVLGTNKSVVIDYTIQVPNGTPAGGYYAALFAQSATAASGGQSSRVTISNRVGELFYLTVPGDLIKDGSVKPLSANLIQANEARANLQVVDNGSVHFLSNIKVKFKSVFGSDNYSVSLERFVLPKTIRGVSVVWSMPPSFGLYKVSGQASAYKTYSLGSKYVLIVSESIRIKALIAVGLIILIVLLDASFGTIIRRMGKIRDKVRK